MPNENNNIEETLKNQLETLPPEIKKALGSIDWAAKILEIGKKHALHIDQLGALQTEIILVLVGLINPDDFIGEIRSKLNLSEDKITAINNDANELIFAPIRQSLIKIYDEELKDVDVEESGEASRNPPDKGGLGGLESREALLQGIENPPVTNENPLDKGGLGGLTQEKMVGTFRLPKQETDYSLVKDLGEKGAIQNTVEPPPPALPKIDLYREKI